MKKQFLCLSLSLIGFLISIKSYAFQTGEEVMQAVYEQSRQYKNQRSNIELIIISGTNKKRVRKFKLLHKIFPERTKSLIKFYKPANVKGTGLLSETLDSENLPFQWIYLPALRSIKKLNVQDQNKSFVGSDFTNNDVAGRQVSRDNHKIFKEDSKKIYIESHPKDSNDIYSKLEIEILRDILVPSQVVFYNRDKIKLKTLTNNRIRKIKNMYVVEEAVMTNHRSGGSSTLKKTSVNFNTIDVQSVGLKGLQN